MDQPQNTEFSEAIATKTNDKRRTEKTFWKLTLVIVVCEVLLISTLFLCALSQLFGGSRHIEIVVRLLKYGAIGLPFLSWFCSLYGLTLGRIILVLAVTTISLITASLFLL
ncbi:MAG: hypothetical protein KZQ75_04260 [Candidatus Thiodiazotropha sp. (ex Myrtea spinifera)]|nr:hypothetical protein [Candidatus Thiodiazotropha sp. (ex Myrtea spinifera)]MCU7829751.1 hypothetical protein [Candidatus Thiodiazotropha sp. (ex Myrtea sp. 'scaly one' KF741663)]